MDIHIGEVVTELSVTDAGSGLAPEDFQRLTAAVLEAVRRERAEEARRERDTQITDRFFRH